MCIRDRAERERWAQVAPRALAFWQAASVDGRISPDFRALCSANAATLQQVMSLA